MGESRFFRNPYFLLIVSVLQQHYKQKKPEIQLAKKAP